MSAKHRVLVALAVFVASPVGANAQQRIPPMSDHPVGSDAVDRIGPKEIQDIRNLVASGSRGAIFPNSLDGRAHYILNFRRDESATERHDQWDDIMIVQQGYGYLDYSRSIKGGEGHGGGEWLGGALTGGLTSLYMSPGVILRIPAGVPHVVRPIGAMPLVYLVLKERTAKSRP